MTPIVAAVSAIVTLRLRSRIACAGSVLLARDRVGELLLVHVRAALDAELLGAVVELLLGVALGVDAAARPLRPVARGLAALGGLRVRRALLVLELPVVALLLGDVLDRRERGAVRALLGVVLLVRAVERLLVGALDLAGRALQRARQILFLGGHGKRLPARSRRGTGEDNAAHGRSGG